MLSRFSRKFGQNLENLRNEYLHRIEEPSEASEFIKNWLKIIGNLQILMNLIKRNLTICSKQIQMLSNF